MSDIFISYKREEQAAARDLADALESQAWRVWWDPKLRAGERFDDVIEEALREARCVIVLWSRRSVRSRYVKDEARYALIRDKLVPVMIEDTALPFRFEGLHTPRLMGWDGALEAPAFQEILRDIRAILGDTNTTGDRAPGFETQDRPIARSQPERAPSSVFRDRLADGSEGPEMVVIPEGEFWMGSDRERDPEALDDELPRHRVRIARSFALGRYPVTFAEYERFAKATGRDLPDDEQWGRGNRPVIHVSWKDAVAYCKWLSEQTRRRYRLPTEAEWEYAARAGTETRYWWGSEIGQDAKIWANCSSCGSEWDDKQTAPVGSFEPNDFGLHDTAGNVWEWVQDCWHDSYEGAPTDGHKAWGSEGRGDCGLRVLRGGSWDGGPGGLRSAHRGGDNPLGRTNDVGFRLAQDL
jgi:formylglycine-generating enzyme required for sulfatase activity